VTAGNAPPRTEQLRAEAKAYMDRYRSTAIGRAKVKAQNRATSYALGQLKRAHKAEYEHYRRVWLADHPLPTGVGKGRRMPS
jgi:hypothetical protein